MHAPQLRGPDYFPDRRADPRDPSFGRLPRNYYLLTTGTTIYWPPEALAGCQELLFTDHRKEPRCRDTGTPNLPTQIIPAKMCVPRTVLAYVKLYYGLPNYDIV